jgi:hypothetical protein
MRRLTHSTPGIEYREATTDKSTVMGAIRSP